MMPRPAVLLALASAAAWAGTGAALATGTPARWYALALGCALVTAMSAIHAGISRMTDDRIAAMLTRALREASRDAPQTPPRPPRGSVHYIGGRDRTSGGAA